jgi:L-cysteine:1D-myo-inositol 2-amino-2-deoxy-alpha-D-glucopyranoside ligase
MESWRVPSVPKLPGRGPETMLTNTATGVLTAAAAGPAATLYACGITPYDATHLGHAATYLAWDLLVRAWRDAGHQVTYVQNVTDVDDPLLERAARDSEDWRTLADREIGRFRADMTALRVLPPDRLVGAVEALDIIERLSARLADRGALYGVDDDQYFSRASDEAFGSVSRLGPAEMTALFAERGGDPGRPGKKDPLDPLVWLAARPGEPSWPSRFGAGRPGWHVECAAIATEYLGTTFDVQTGGRDLIFPHHEMSASHARVALGPGAFARCYAHAGMVRLDGEKMSKSLGNLVFVSRLLAGGADPMAVRLAVLAHHYRQDWDWTAEGLAAAAARLGRWREAAQRGAAGVVPAAGPAAAVVLAEVRERLAADLDAPGALAVVDRWAGAVLADPAVPQPARPGPDRGGPDRGGPDRGGPDRGGPGGGGPDLGGADSDRPGSAEAALVRDTVDALLGINL